MNNKKTYECIYCNKLFTQISTLNRHIKDRCIVKNEYIKISVLAEEKKILNEKINLLEEEKKNLNEKIIILEGEKKILNIKNDECEKNNKIIQLQNKQYETQLNEYKNEIKTMRNQIESLINERIIEKNNHIDILKKQIETQEKDKENIGQIAKGAIKVSMDALSYANKHFNNALPLRELNYEQIKNLIEEKYDFNDENMFIKTLGWKHKQKNIYTFIANFIIIIYKDEPQKQSFWNTDSSRLTFIIRNTINEEVIWMKDNKAKKIIIKAIRPTLQYIKDIIRKYLRQDINNIEDDDEKTKFLLEGGIYLEIINDIETGSMEQGILKCIAPDFYLNKNDTSIISNF